MASPPLPTDHDGFDWEAAVREIDSACQNASTLGSIQEDPARPPPAQPATAGGLARQAKPSGKPRQSTLDRFVDSFQKHARSGGRGLGRTPPVRENAPLDYDHADDDNVGGSDDAPAVQIDLGAAQTWIYPVNVPRRDYQFSIAETALFSNTLVALPTGLGKTLIAAVVMYNYFRWFPEGKIVFTAPSRPLVMQQIEACHNIVGIPQEWTIDMTGQMSPPKRSNFWKSKRVFFVTPQVLEKDIQSGICLVKQLVCLVIDEAHRAMGNYAYCVAVRELMAVPVRLRILALTATPGSKQRTVQNVIDNLCISTLEYRNESEKDVSPYVHDRKIELVEVAMGKDAVEINNLLLEAIQPFVTRLCAIGVLYNKDFATLSPCELLNSRDKFRQAPPLNLPHAKYGEVEGYFGLLITLYHLRKLLSSHGIRPAYEMLKEKLEHGSFARLMRRNETIWKVKLLMHQSLSHGAPNPKLVKMIEILIDHFKEKDPRESRVIIFSNFRGSVKDIMSSLSSIEDFVRATEFIGQSSGKVLKGQSQKVQQAVLQKFRSGGYNVIVATSIGEEGLDIVEVDLVICFDANVSPLRMIQRMGRTGRKHDGRVVVLACEGSELKGYLKKQASSKAVRKHMHNGGVKSFNFHSSPRMIPHIYKPQVQFVELAIEQFVPRGKKLNDVAAHPSPYLKKVSDEESALIARYFHSSEEDTWRPSLIAFPHFQAFPSGVHRVRHSFKTTAMLIDAMQHLQAVPCSKAKMASTIKDEAFSSQPLKDSIDVQGAANELLEADFKDKTSDLEPSWEKEHEGKTSDLEPYWEKENEGLKLHDLLQKPSHCFIFGGDFVTVNAFGSICISSVPILPLKGHHKSEFEGENDVDCLENTRKDASTLKVSGLHNHTQLKDTTGITISCEFRCMNSEGILESHTPKCDTQKQQQIETFLHQTPVCKGKVTASENGLTETPQDTGCVLRASLASKSRNSSKDTDLSPRLTHFIEEGIVPESPVEISHHSPKLENTVSSRFTPKHDNCWSKTSRSLTGVHIKKVPMVAPLCLEAIYDDPGMNESFMPCHVSPNTTELSSLGSKEFSNLDKRETGRVKNIKHQINTEENLAGSPIHMNIQTPLANSKNNSSSEDWQINSDEAAKSVVRAPKYKRLCRNWDIGKEIPCKTIKEKFNSFINSAGETATRTELDQTHCKKGKKEKLKGYVNSFIDDEVEVSEDAEVSEDEEDHENGDGYDDSFIDDRANPSEGSTREENSGCDMMAFYRRSLLTQSPLIQTCMTTSHDSVSPRTEDGSSSLKILSGSSKIFQDSAKQSSVMNSVTCQLHSGGVILQAEPSSSQREYSEKLESRKRKLNFQLDGSVPAEKMQSFPFEYTGKTSRHYQSETAEVSNGLLCDDDFYHGIDLDELEAEATKLLQYKSQLPIDNVHKIFHNNSSETKIDPSMNLLSSPSFDLGV